jgi:uncharacterized RDD family membrane protein YckC
VSGHINIANAQRPSLLRQFAAILYDCLLLVALLTLADAVVVLPLGIIFHIDGSTVAAYPLFRLYLLFVIIGFFCWFWLRGGQTLGMRAWRIMLVRSDGAGVRLGDALSRLAAASLSWAALGMGFLWSLLDRDGLTWHDRLSGTRLVLLKKPKKQPEGKRPR